jgi:DnaJ family protein A protein 2
MTQDLYSVLGITKEASQSDIKKAYKKLAFKHHPDKGGDEEMFKKISHAYSILSDEAKRKQYDTFGTVDEQDGMNMQNFQDIFESMFSGQGGGFETMFGGGPFGGMFQMASNRQSEKSPEKHINLKVSLEEVFTGKTIPYRLLTKKYTSGMTCVNCQGKGRLQQCVQIAPGMMTQSISNCTVCKGSGKTYDEKYAIRKEEIVEIPIPKGIPSGQRLAIRGKGDEYSGIERGDVIVTVEHKPHSTFQKSSRNPFDIILKHSIRLDEYLFGFSHYFTFLDGKTYSIQYEGNQKLEQPFLFRIPGKGFQYRNNSGDLVCSLELQYPSSDTIQDLWGIFKGVPEHVKSTDNQIILSKQNSESPIL